MTERIGDTLVICAEPPGWCEQCREVDELRPYGKRKPDGSRMRICFDCAMKDKATTDTALAELFEGGSKH